MSMLSFKLPDPVLHEVESVAQMQGMSKGALIREALGEYLQKRSNLNQIEEITKRHKAGKVSKKTTDWSDLYAKTRVKTSGSAAEEVRRMRLRGL